MLIVFVFDVIVENARYLSDFVSRIRNCGDSESIEKIAYCLLKIGNRLA